MKKILAILLFSLLFPLVGFSETWTMTTSVPHIWTITFTKTGGTPPNEQFNFTGSDGKYESSGTATLVTNTDGYFYIYYTSNSGGLLCDFIGQKTSTNTAEGRQICPGNPTFGYYGSWTAVLSN